MSHLYIKGSKSVLVSLNENLYKLTRPDSVRNPEDVTSCFSAIIQHALEPDVFDPLFIIPHHHDIPVHPEALTSQMAELADPDEREDLETLIAESRGTSRSVVDFIPPSLKDVVYTREEAEELDYFGVSRIPVFLDEGV